VTVPLRHEVRRFLSSVAFKPEIDSWLVAPDPEFSCALGERGWIGMTWPREYGGREASPLERYIVVEELLAAGAPVAAHWFAERQIGPSLLRHGTTAQCRDFLPRIAAGKCYFAVGMSEPNSGSDLASVSTRASRSGSTWVVTGSKIWTTGAVIAHYVLALCRTADTTGPPREGLSQLIIPLDAAGVMVRPIDTMNGRAELNEIIFNDVRVPGDYLLGRAGAGWPQVMEELADERGGPERYLSMFPVVRELAARAARQRDSSTIGVLGTTVSRLWSVRSLGMAHVVQSTASKTRRATGAALTKDVGTTYERQLLEDARLVLHSDGVDQAPPIFKSAIMNAPSVTLRGGTTEVLRDIIWRETTTGSPHGETHQAGHRRDAVPSQ
jgi:alkylation response protein AidB-like acyl-CoA dehydrogenase